MWQQHSLCVDTLGRGFVDLGPQLAALIAEAGLLMGLCHLFLRHTSAGLCITENADPEVHRDLERFAARLAPDGDPLFRHGQEGPDDMPAHVCNVVTGCELTIPVGRGRLVLGTWQGVYLWEYRHTPHRREIVVTLHGESAAAG